MRDMTKRQFAEALKRYGMEPEGFMGYVRLNVPGHHICVSHWNAGPNLRAKLAYLIREQERRQAEAEAEQRKEH